MLEIKIVLEAAELAAAMQRLAEALEGRGIPAPQPPQEPKPKGTAAPVPKPKGTAAPVQTEVPAANPTTAPAPVQPAPTTGTAAPTPAPDPAPATAAPTAPAAADAAPVPAIADIAKAGAALVNNGRRDDLIALLARHGVQAVTQLKPEQLSAVATDLRALGAQL